MYGLKVQFHDFYCTKCGNKGLSLPRKIGQLREPGHLKRMYCFSCKDEINFAEISAGYSYDDFKYEYEHNNFQDGLRIKTIKQCLSEREEA